MCPESSTVATAQKSHSAHAESIHCCFDAADGDRVRDGRKVSKMGELLLENISTADDQSRLLFRAMPIPCVLLNSDYHVIECNNAALEKTLKYSCNRALQAAGLQKCELRKNCSLGNDCKDFSHIGFEKCFGRRYFIDNFLQVVLPNRCSDEEALKLIGEYCLRAELAQLSEETYRFEYEFTTFCGKAIPGEVTVVPFKINGKKVYACYVLDLREERMRLMAEQESMSKTRLLAYMSHEIRTPINSVLGIAEAQLQNEKLSPEVSEGFLRIHNSSKVLLNIINDILDLSKVSSGKMEIIPHSYDLLTLIADSVQLSLIYHDDKKIGFVLKVDENLPSSLIGDESRIAQIIVNLLSNAFKYTDDGVVSLSLGFEHKTAEDFLLVVEVMDTGKGMADEQVSIICEDFVRFYAPGKRISDGIGLGMPITSHLIKLMGGELIIKSALGVGSTFTVKIPQKIVADAQALGRDMVDKLNTICTSNRPLTQIERLKRHPMPYGRVLVVDDLESNRFVAKQFILPYSIDVQTAQSGDEAIFMLQEGEVYDIIFMDHMMPGMDGIEATKKIREMGYMHPIIALTANAVKGMKETFLASGFTDFLEKPIQLKTIDDCLMRYVRGKQPKEVIAATEAAGASSSEEDDDVDAVYAKNLAEPFIADAKKAIVNIELLLERQDWSKRSLAIYTLQAHNIKGALQNIGRMSFSKEAFALERAGLDGNIDQIKRLTPGFLDDLKSLISTLLPKEINIMDEALSDQELSKLQELLSALSSSCKSYDINSTYSLAESLTDLRLPHSVRDTVNDISRKVLHGAFEEAGNIADKECKRIGGLRDAHHEC